MEWLKYLPLNIILGFVPMLLIKIGNDLKSKDTNTTGADDAFGNVLIALAPAVVALESGNDTAIKKALKAAYITLGNYLGYAPPAS
jgi:hypothetical protein